MKEKRRDNKGRILHTGESQRTDGKYLYKYVDAFGNTKYVYAWRLTPTDPTPKGKREKPSLRELEQQIRRDIEDGIDSTGKKMTLCQLYAKQNAQRANVKKSTQKQRELADKIGINMQSLSKIERGVNYPTFDTLEKIMDVLGVTPNELLSGEWKYVNQAEKEVCQFLRIEERLNAELKHGHYDNFFDSEEEWLEYELKKLREYITDYINGKSIVASDLYPIKEFIQHLKFQKLLDHYDDLYSMDMFGESIEGHKYRTPYQVVKMINPNSKEDMELLREVLKNNDFDDEDE